MPFNRFRTAAGVHVDTLLGPEMRSTGEVMGFDASFGAAFAKAQIACVGGLPTSGRVFVSVANRDKRHMIFPIKRLADLGFEILATAGTAAVLRRNGVDGDRRTQAFRGSRARRRTDHRQPDPGRRHRPRGQHAARHHLRRLAARRRLRDPHRLRRRQHRLHHHGARACGHRAGDRGGPRRAASGCGRCRAGRRSQQPADGLRCPVQRRARSPRCRTRPPAGVRDVALGGSGAGARRDRAGRRRDRGTPAGGGAGLRPHVPRTAGHRRRLRQERPSASTRWPRSASASSRSAP